MKNILLFLLFASLYNCKDVVSSNQDKQVRRSFQTTAPSRLYFKNMRSFYYEQITKTGTQIDLYTLKKFKQTATPPLLMPILADNWLEDEVYILFKTNDLLTTGDTLQLQLEQGKTIDTLLITDFEITKQHRLAKELWDKLTQGHKISMYTIDLGWQPLFKNQAERANFLTVLKDYDRLTEFE